MQRVETTGRAGRAAHLVARTVARSTWQRLRDQAGETLSAEQADELRAAFRADVAAHGNAWWVDPVDARPAGRGRAGRRRRGGAAVRGRRRGHRRRAGGRAPARCGLDLGVGGPAAAGPRSRIPTCAAGAALVAGGDERGCCRAPSSRGCARRTPRCCRPTPRTPRSTPTSPAACCPWPAARRSPTCSPARSRERGSLAGDDRFLLVRGGTDPAILPLECRYLVCAGALIVIGPDGAGGEQVWAAESPVGRTKGRERTTASRPLAAPCYICIIRIELPDESRKPASMP